MTADGKAQGVPRWAAGLTHAPTFNDEQDRLGRMWGFLGLTTDIPRDNDWFRTTLGGRSVFVQRFGEEVRAFENVCPHRFYPLRTGKRGNGVIRCGFHHWQYNQEGAAVGIPKCREMFGRTPREMGVVLTPVEIATCGALIFGRFSGGTDGGCLEAWLGDIHPILDTLCRPSRRPRRLDMPIKANWKLLYHISMDDYHLVAVHGDTFGKHGYLPADGPRYHRMGMHSAHFLGGPEDGLARMADDCRRDAYRPSLYRIFNLFPNLLVVQFQAGPAWHLIVQHLLPQAPDRTLSRAWSFAVPCAPEDRTPFHALVRRAAEPVVGLVVPRYMRKIFREDNVVCEAVQQVAPQIRGMPILARHETRIRWFEEAYAEAMGVPGGEPLMA